MHNSAQPPSVARNSSAEFQEFQTNPLQCPAGSIHDLEVLLCSSDWVEYFVTARRPEELPRCPIVTFTPLTPQIAALAQHKGTFVLY